MKYILGSVRVITLAVYTIIQISFLIIDGWINGASVRVKFKHRRIWARNALKILGIKIDVVVGEVPSQSGLVISNHRTLLDPVIQFAYIDAFVIAKAEVANLPIISQGAKLTGIIFVKREKLKSRYAARQKTEELLKEGHNVLVYAEGTTVTTQTTGEFKVGTFGIAANNNIPVIPMAIEYPKEKDYWLAETMTKQIYGQIGAWSTHVKLYIGSPIKNNNTNELLAAVQKEIDHNLLEMQAGWSEMFADGKANTDS